MKSPDHCKISHFSVSLNVCISFYLLFFLSIFVSYTNDHYNYIGLSSSCISTCFILSLASVSLFSCFSITLKRIVLSKVKVPVHFS